MTFITAKNWRLWPVVFVRSRTIPNLFYTLSDFTDSICISFISLEDNYYINLFYFSCQLKTKNKLVFWPTFIQTNNELFFFTPEHPFYLLSIFIHLWYHHPLHVYSFIKCIANFHNCVLPVNKKNDFYYRMFFAHWFWFYLLLTHDTYTILYGHKQGLRLANKYPLTTKQNKMIILFWDWSCYCQQNCSVLTDFIIHYCRLFSL